VLVPAVAFADFVLAIHILSAVIGFGIIFAYPVLLASASRVDPNVMPWLFRTRQRLGRVLVNPGLLFVVLAGIYLASDLHQWSAFYVQWGIAAAIVIGAVEGSFMIPRQGRLAEIAERDLAATAVPAGGRRTSATWSEDYNQLFRQLSLGGTVMALVVVVTVFLMATHAGA
jgi:Predicted integral membrane protein (DUF2269)